MVAFVPEYGQLRTFAVDRIRSLSLTEERFEPVDREEDAFAHSLGVHQGAPERIEIEFDPRIARYVKERLWHSSQEIEEQADGTDSPHAERVERFCAAQLDPGLRRAGEGGVTADAGGADSSGSRGTKRYE